MVGGWCEGVVRASEKTMLTPSFSETCNGGEGGIIMLHGWVLNYYCTLYSSLSCRLYTVFTVYVTNAFFECTYSFKFTFKTLILTFCSLRYVVNFLCTF